MEQFNSNFNQDIKRKFVDREVLANVSLMVEYILAKSGEEPDPLFSYEDIENQYYYESEDQNRFTESARQEQLFEWKTRLEILREHEPEATARIRELERRIDHLENADPIMPEIYEWWIVSDFLATELARHGECLLSCGYNQVWGRQTTGQAILLDHVISVICDDLEILSGQSRQWKP